ncbi:MAG: hypothetical protein C0402_03280 [Thermodesulfovibrio sp.]|nr:hypothetical protein [Thermodesulfovibrio sp.]
MKGEDTMNNIGIRFLMAVMLFCLTVAPAWAGVEGTNSTFIGLNAGGSTAIFSDTHANTFVGASTGLDATSGSYNAFLGFHAGQHNTSGNYNTFLGATAGLSNVSGGSMNTYVGASAGFYTTGSNNTFIGYNAGSGALVTGSGNVFIGKGAGENEDTSNKLYIANTNTFYPLIYGEFDNAAVTIYGSLSVASVASPSDERLKKNIQPLESSLEKVMKLRGVSYDWKTEEYAGRGLGTDRQIGLLAQNVEEVIPVLVKTDKKGYKAVTYEKMVPVLVEAIKEQQGMIKERDAKIEKLEKALEALEKRVAGIDTPARTLALRSITSALSMTLPVR